ncbi:MAG: type III pantothenate kinase [Nitrospirae bacterium]|nr:type III pantothenate kinase [Nitrospirota bacterium]
MLLTIDIGNTNIVLGLFEKKTLTGEWRISTHPHKTVDEYAILMEDLFSLKKILPEEITGAILSSVVPPLTPIFKEISVKYFQTEALVVSTQLKMGIRFEYEHPAEIGADRIVNAVAGYQIYGGPLIIVDFGTATTFCSLSKKGDYRGGVIAPGLTISAEALFQRAAKLPKIELVKPDRVIGKDTITSMQSGIIFGYAGLVERLIEKIKQETKEKAMVVATGGLSALIAPEAPAIDKVDPHLTLEGLRIIYDLNSRPIRRTSR